MKPKKLTCSQFFVFEDCGGPADRRAAGARGGHACGRGGPRRPRRPRLSESTSYSCPDFTPPARRHQRHRSIPIPLSGNSAPKERVEERLGERAASPGTPPRTSSGSARQRPFLRPRPAPPALLRSSLRERPVPVQHHEADGDRAPEDGAHDVPQRRVPHRLGRHLLRVRHLGLDLRGRPQPRVGPSGRG